MAASHSDWEATTREILDALDIRAEYESLGIRFSSERVSSGGWLECHAAERDDRNPSAAVNVGTGPQRGRYRDLGGRAESLSLFDFAAKYGSFAGDWKEARRHYAKRAGVKLPSGQKTKDFDDQLAFEPWNDALVEHWCSLKKGITPAALRDAGGQLCKWPKKDGKYPCIALPVYGSKLTGGPVTGWVLWHRGGRELPVFQGKNVPPKWVKMKSLAGTTKGWMGRGALDRLADAKVVWKVEGPGDMAALAGLIPPELQLEHVVITNSGGCAEIPDREMISHLEGKTVYVLHDADKPGQGIIDDEPHRVSGARLWSREIANIAHECRNVQLPFPIADNHGKDTRDYVNEGATYQDFLNLAAQAPVVDPPDYKQPTPPAPGSGGAAVVPPDDHGADDGDRDLFPGDEPHHSHHDDDCPGHGIPETTHDEAVCRALQIDVLGELASGGVQIFSQYHRKLAVIKDVSRLTVDKLIQLCGPPARSAINKSSEPIEGQYSLNQIKESIGMLAGFRRIKEDGLCGIGVWQGKSIRGEESQSVILVGAGEAARLNGDRKLRRITSPRADGLLLDLSKSDGWYDFDHLAPLVERAYTDKGWVREAIDEMVAVFSRWRWKKQRTVPTVVTGLVMASWVQSLWKWRPQVAIIGNSNSGKTTAFTMLGGDKASRGLFGNLALMSSQSSEAGIRQAIKHDSSILILDEFENSKEREKVLNLFRTSSRGSKKLMGTSSQDGTSYGLNHIPWVAAIEVGLKREPDRNRFIILELDTPPESEFGKLVLPPESWLVEHGQKLLAIALAHVQRAVPLAVELKSTKVAGIDSRVIESYSVPAAILGVCSDMGVENARHLLKLMLDDVERAEQGRSDVVDLIDDLMTAPVDCGHGIRISISQLIANKSELYTHQDAMEAHGVGLIDENDGRKTLFVAHRVATKRLLRGTDWDGQDISQLLVRVPGASRSRRRLAGMNARGVVVPMEWMNEKFLGDATAAPAVGTQVNLLDGTWNGNGTGNGTGF